MNFQYNTGLSNAPPVSPDFRATALAGLVPSMPGYGQNFEDNARKLGAANRAAFNIDASKANADYDLAQAAAQNALVSRGLEMLGEQRGQQRGLGLERMRMVTGLLGGLFS